MADVPGSENNAEKSLPPRKHLASTTHRHELLCCLLDSLQRTERAEEAVRVCVETTLVAARDLKPSDPNGGGEGGAGEGLGYSSMSSREARAAAWLRMTRTVLQVGPQSDMDLLQTLRNEP